MSGVPANISSIAVAIGESLSARLGRRFGRFTTRTSVWFDDGSEIVAKKTQQQQHAVGTALEDFTCASTPDDDTYLLGARLISPSHAWPPPDATGGGGLGMQGAAPIAALSRRVVRMRCMSDALCTAHHTYVRTDGLTG